MAGQYGQSGSTYGQASGTYGALPVTSTGTRYAQSFSATARITQTAITAATYGQGGAAYGQSAGTYGAFASSRTSQTLSTKSRIFVPCSAGVLYNAAIGYSQPNYLYNACNSGIITRQTLSIAARISRHSTSTVSTGARILRRSNSTFSSLTRLSTLSTRYTQTISARSRISRKSYTTISAQTRIKRRNTAATQLRVRIANYSRYDTDVRARLYYHRVANFSTGALIFGAHYKSIAALARLTKYQTTNILSFARISHTNTYAMTMLSTITKRLNVQVKSTIKALTFQQLVSGARIFKKTTLGLIIGARVIRLSIFQIKARVANVDLQSIGVKVNLYARRFSALSIGARLGSTRQSLSMRANINHQLQVRGRVSRRQGYPELEPWDIGYSLFQPTALNVKATITNSYALTTQQVLVGGRIKLGGTLSLQPRARIATNAGISMRGSIRAAYSTINLLVTYSVEQVKEIALRVVFYIEGTTQQTNVATRANITTQKEIRLRVLFTVPYTLAGPVVSFGYDAELGKSSHYLGSCARIRQL